MQSISIMQGKKKKELFQMLPQSLETEKLPVSNMLSKKVFLRFDYLEFESIHRTTAFQGK